MTVDCLTLPLYRDLLYDLPDEDGLNNNNKNCEEEEEEEDWLQFQKKEQEMKKKQQKEEEVEGQRLRRLQEQLARNVKRKRPSDFNVKISRSQFNFGNAQII